MKRPLGKKAKAGFICGAIMILVLAAGFFMPTWTPAIKGENSISMLKQVPINGTGHEVMIRGEDRSNPIVIFVHGGPGCSEIPYIREYQKRLERNFTIVHYDQRGSGKSFHFGEDYSALSSDLLVEDLLALTDYVTAELGESRVLLAGHSFGTYIGMKAAAQAPEKFAAYIGIGQVADHRESELDGLNFAMEQAIEEGNTGDAERLERLRPDISEGKGLTPRDLIRKYGGAARQLNDNMLYVKGFLLAPEYNLLDVVRYWRGVGLSQKILLAEEMERGIPDIVDKLEIPCFFVMGQYDYMTSTKAARTYFDRLEAPRKEFMLFSESAHYPQLEEEERFAEWMEDRFLISK
jgi:L-proline amide hydrolase